MDVSRLRSHIVSSIVCSLVLASGCSSEPPPSGGPVGARSDAIVNGKLDTTHHAVMLENCATKCICTGTLVKKDETTGVGWVVTAGHCMADPGKEPVLRFYVQGDKAATYEADYVNTLEPGAIRYPVLDWVRHPDYKAASVLNGPSNDIGIVRILGIGSETPVLPLAPAEDGLKADMPAVDVGYGSSGPFNDPKDFGIAGTRQRADVTIKSVDSKLVVIDGNDPGGSINSGDSGGPVLAMVGGVESVVGIHSTRSSGLGGTKQNNTRVSAARTWLDTELAKTPKLDTCNTCLGITTGGVHACATTSLKCLDDADCNEFAICVEACAKDGDIGPNKACRDTCAAEHPNAPALYEPALSCGCQTCALLCGDTCEGLPPPPSTGGDADAGPPTTKDGNNNNTPAPAPENAVDAAPAADSGCRVSRTGGLSTFGGAAVGAMILGLVVRRRRSRRD